MRLLRKGKESTYIFHRNAKEILAFSWRLFVRTIGAKYRQSFLGYFWMVLPAILVTAAVSLAGRAGLINPGDTVLPYPLFVLSGTLLWQVFAEAVEVPYKAFVGARSYLTRVYCSRVAIILVQLYEAIVVSMVKMTFVLLLLWIFTDIGMQATLLISACFLVAVLLGVGIGAVLAPFMLLIQDLHNTVRLILTYGLFLTPALYIPGEATVFSALVQWNPITPLMDSMRSYAANAMISHSGLGFTFLAAAALTGFGMFLVHISAPIVIERMLLGGR